MKPNANKSPKKNSVAESDDDNVRYKLNVAYFNKLTKPKSRSKSPSKLPKSDNQVAVTNDEEDNVRYKLAEPILKLKPLDMKTIRKSENKVKARPKIKVNFWSSKQNNTRLNRSREKEHTNRRHTFASSDNASSKPKSSVKVRKRVSFLPSPLFSENHVPMVTVPDDLTIALNEEEANELKDDLNEAIKNPGYHVTHSTNSQTTSKSSTTQTSPKGKKRRHSPDDTKVQINETELECFSKYIVQKLRKMETNQRIYSENLINTVLMLGQFGTLNGKSKVTNA